MGRRRKRSRTPRVVLTLALLVVGALLAYANADRLLPSHAPAATHAPPAEGILRVHYVDVGQGDGTIWEMPDGTIIVYDCGPPARSAAENPMVAYLRGPLARADGTRIDALVASHGHLDHIGGCDEIFDVYDVAHVYDTNYPGDDAPASYRRFLARVASEGATLHDLGEIHPGALLPALSARITFLWPRELDARGWDHIAETSLVVRLAFGKTSFCFQGDIEIQQEARLDGVCDVYLVGHHGSRHASSAAWLARMGPDIAVVSYGDNSYGHPTPEALCRVTQAGAALYATAGAGAVIVETTGTSVRVAQGARDLTDHCRTPETT